MSSAQQTRRVEVVWTRLKEEYLSVTRYMAYSCDNPDGEPLLQL